MEADPDKQVHLSSSIDSTDAIEILERKLLADPGNPRLLSLLSEWLQRQQQERGEQSQP